MINSYLRPFLIRAVSADDDRNNQKKLDEMFLIPSLQVCAILSMIRRGDENTNTQNNNFYCVQKKRQAVQRKITRKFIPMTTLAVSRGSIFSSRFESIWR